MFVLRLGGRYYIAEVQQIENQRYVPRDTVQSPAQVLIRVIASVCKYRKIWLRFKQRFEYNNSAAGA